MFCFCLHSSLYEITFRQILKYTNIQNQWLVGLRPEGDRCLVYACDGHTVSRNRRGIFIHEYFPSLLPAGNAFDCKKKLVTILDCIWIQARKTYFVMDCLCWENRLICLSDAAMRLWFIAGKFKECAAIHQISIKRNRYRFQCIQTFNVTSDNLSFLYSGGSLINEQQKKKNLKKNQQEINPRNSNLYIGVDIHYRRMKGKNKRRWKKSNKKNKKQKSQESMDVCPMSIDINIQKPKVNVNRKVMNLRPDGFIFYHKRGMYVEGRSCPLILIWKDCRISPYFIETQNKHKSDINSNNNCNQMLKNDMCGSILAALKVNADGNVTAYEEDIILGNICYDNCGLDAVLMKQRNIQPNDLLKFLVLNASILNIAADEGKDIGNYCNVERLQFVRKCASTKMNADVFSKIVFQSQAQNGKCITFEEMMRFVSNENVKNVNNAGLLPRTDEEWEREGANVDSLLSIHTLGL